MRGGRSPAAVLHAYLHGLIRAAVSHAAPAIGKVRDINPFCTPRRVITEVSLTAPNGGAPAQRGCSPGSGTADEPVAARSPIARQVVLTVRNGPAGPGDGGQRPGHRGAREPHPEPVRRLRRAPGPGAVRDLLQRAPHPDLPPRRHGDHRRDRAAPRHSLAGLPARECRRGAARGWSRLAVQKRTWYQVAPASVVRRSRLSPPPNGPPITIQPTAGLR